MKGFILKTGAFDMNSEAKKLIENLELKPHEEGGWFRFVWSSDAAIPQSSLPSRYSGERKNVSMIYYLLEGSDVSSWHKLHSDEIWLWHSGGSLKITLGGKGPHPEPEKELLLGPRYTKGESFQIIAPAETWQTAKIAEGEYALVSCIVSVAFHPDDFLLYRE